MTEPAHDPNAPDPLSLDAELPSSLMTVNLGPSHPAMHGTVRCVMELSGEIIEKVDVQVG